MSGENIKRANWLELLFDLIFVYAVSKATHILAHAHAGHIGLGQYITFVLVMIPIWWTWTGHTLYSTRFDTEDRTHRLLTLATMLAVVFWTTFINADFDPYYHGYLFFYILIRLILIVMYWATARSNSIAIPIARRLSTGFLLGLTVASLSLLFEPTYRYLVLYLGIGIEILTPLVSRKVLKAIPVKSHHLPERYGLLTIILFGESVIMLATSLSGEQLNVAMVTAAIAGFILMASLWWLYFDLMDNDVLGQELGTGQHIIYGHLFIYIGLSSIAVYISFAIVPGLHLKDHLLLCAFGISTLSVGLLIAFGWSRLSWSRHWRLYLPVILCIAISALSASTHG